eukprot:619411-Hanusia_phi.AAC.1
MESINEIRNSTKPDSWHLSESQAAFFNYTGQSQAKNARDSIEAQICGAGGKEKPIVHLKSEPPATVIVKWMSQDVGLKEVCVKLKNYHPRAFYHKVVPDKDDNYRGCHLAYFIFRKVEEAVHAKHNYEKWIQQEY